jgi:hypothetical protein
MKYMDGNGFSQPENKTALPDNGGKLILIHVQEPEKPDRADSP